MSPRTDGPGSRASGLQGDGPRDVEPGRGAVVGWCLYDWANSAFPTVITTFVFAAYFAKGVAANETHGTYLWGNAVAVAALGIAVLSPVLGAVAEVLMEAGIDLSAVAGGVGMPPGQPAAMGGVPGAAAAPPAEAGKIWTPGGEQAGGGGEKKIWTPD